MIDINESVMQFLLAFVVVGPLLGAAAALPPAPPGLKGKSPEQSVLRHGVTVTGAILIATVVLALGFDHDHPSKMQATTDISWIPALDVRIHLGMPDSTGRQTPQEIPNSHTNIPADLVLKALGFDPEDLPALLKAPDLGVTGWGTLKIDWKSMMTNLDGVFAVGGGGHGGAVFFDVDRRHPAPRADLLAHVTHRRRGLALHPIIMVHHDKRVAEEIA